MARARQFFPWGVCGGAGRIDEERDCEPKGGGYCQIDCSCSGCSGRWDPNSRDYVPPVCWVRCSDCGCVFNCIAEWHESATGAAVAIVGPGRGTYPHRKMTWLERTRLWQADPIGFNFAIRQGHFAFDYDPLVRCDH